MDMAQALDHFDAFCAWKDTPNIRYNEYCQACLAVLPGSRAAKIDSKLHLNADSELYLRSNGLLKAIRVRSGLRVVRRG